MCPSSGGGRPGPCSPASSCSAPVPWPSSPCRGPALQAQDGAWSSARGIVSPRSRRRGRSSCSPSRRATPVADRLWVWRCRPIPPAIYAGALGGNATNLVDWYQVSAELPGFVGDPTYKGEQLLTWLPAGRSGLLIEPIGIFHAGFQLLAGLPVLDASDTSQARSPAPGRAAPAQREPAPDSRSASIELSPYRPVARAHDGRAHQRAPAVLHAWLVVLEVFSPALRSERPAVRYAPRSPGQPDRRNSASSTSAKTTSSRRRPHEQGHRRAQLHGVDRPEDLSQRSGPPTCKRLRRRTRNSRGPKHDMAHVGTGLRDRGDGEVPRGALGRGRRSGGRRTTSSARSCGPSRISPRASS